MPLPPLHVAVNSFVACALFAFAALIIVAGRRRRDGILLAAFLALVGVNFAGNAMWTPWSLLVAEIALALDPVLLLLFVAEYPFPRRSWTLSVAIVLVAGLAAAAVASHVAVPGAFLVQLAAAGPRVALEHALAVSVLAVGYPVAWFLACHSATHAPTPLLARRARWLLVAVGITVIPRIGLLPSDFGLASALARATLVQLALAGATFALGVAAVWAGPRAHDSLRAVGATGVAAGALLVAPMLVEVAFLPARPWWGWPPAFGLRWVALAAILAYGMLLYEVVELRRASDALLAPLAGALAGLAAGLAAWVLLVMGSVPPPLAGVAAVATGLSALVPATLGASSALRRIERRMGLSDASCRRIELYHAALEAAWAHGAPSAPRARRLEEERVALGVSPAEARALEHVVAASRSVPPSLRAGDEPIPGVVIEGRLGEGAQGRVFAARRFPGRERVVVKEFRSARAGLLAELRGAMAIEHPNVVRLLGVHARPGSYLLVLEHVEGATLAQRLERGPLSPREARAVASGLLSALASAHAVGVVHRDVKPSNVLLDAGGRPHLTDFGASLTRPDVESWTVDGLLGMERLAGTVAYMAPEQATGGRVDARTDVYAAGLVLYECLTGRPALDVRGRGLIEALAIVAAPRIDLSPLPAAWRRVLAAAVDRDPARRFASAEEMRLALEDEHAPAHREDGPWAQSYGRPG